MDFQVIFLFFSAGVVVAGLACVLAAKFLTEGWERQGGREGKDVAWPKLLKVVPSLEASLHRRP